MPKIDIDAIETRSGSSYPGGLAKQMDGRHQKPLSKAGGLTQFGANLVMLDPGALSSLRHWHEQQDEFLMVTQGVCTLIDDHGETELHPGDCAAFPAGDANGHHIKNKTDDIAAFIVVGTYTPTEVGHYSDVDMMVTIENGNFNFTKRDGTPVADVQLDD